MLCMTDLLGFTVLDQQCQRKNWQTNNGYMIKLGIFFNCAVRTDCLLYLRRAYADTV